jgi:phytoene dehydrogenase-like protein
MLVEVLVIGAGPAGLTAGIYCRMRSMSVLVLDAGRPGGQLVSVYGDKPVHDGDWFFNVSAISDTVFEYRNVVTPVGSSATARPGSLDVFGSSDQTAQKTKPPFGANLGRL